MLEIAPESLVRQPAAFAGIAADRLCSSSPSTAPSSSLSKASSRRRPRNSKLSSPSSLLPSLALSVRTIAATPSSPSTTSGSRRLPVCRCASRCQTSSATSSASSARCRWEVCRTSTRRSANLRRRRRRYLLQRVNAVPPLAEVRPCFSLFVKDVADDLSQGTSIR